MGNFWKYGFALGAGIALGAVGAMLLSKNSNEVKKAFSTLLSHGMDLKDKAASAMDTAKENMEDMAAEARHASQKRHAGPVRGGAKKKPA